MTTENALFNSCIKQVVECYAKADDEMRRFGNNELGQLMADPYYTAASRILTALVDTTAMKTFTEEQRNLVIDMSIKHMKETIIRKTPKSTRNYTPPTLY